jgi:hypothetical protein
MPRRAPNGRPSVAKGRDGYWHAWVDFGRDPTTGKRLRTHVKKATRKAATAAVAELETERATGVRRAPGSLGEWLDGWLAGVESSRKPSTARSYQGHARCYIVPRLGTIPLNALTTEDVEAMLAWCVSPSGPAISAVTAESVRRTLRAALNEAVRRGRLVRNPAQWARSPRGPVVEVDTIALSDIPAIVAQLGGNPMRARWLLALTTGTRHRLTDAGNLAARLRRSSGLRCPPLPNHALSATLFPAYQAVPEAMPDRMHRARPRMPEQGRGRLDPRNHEERFPADCPRGGRRSRRAA